MAEEGETDQNAVIRGILESMVSGELPPRGVSADSVAQLLAAALAQAGQSMLNVQGSSQTRGDVSQDEQVSGGDQIERKTPISEDNFIVNPKDTMLQEEGEQNIQLDDTEVISTVEIPTSEKPRLLCIKFPIELRRRIIALRKEGKKCRDIAKELKVSVSGVRKVWERFLATGMVHDRKPSTYAGRPRKYPISPRFEIQYTSDNTVDTETTHIEYVTISQSESGETIPVNTTSTAVSEDGNVFVEGPLDMPGATVEIVETDPQPVLTPRGRSKSRKEAPAYREQLLLRLIEDCPLSLLRNDVSKRDSPHVLNLESISKRPLYMEYVFGHPFGKVPASKPFEGDVTEANIILSDPANPLGKDLLATLGYSTKVYFNICCKPSSLFDPDKVLSDLPFSLGPGYIAETTQTVLQLLVNLCKDPVAGLNQIPHGNGWSLVATSPDGTVMTSEFSVPDKLSTYWTLLYECASLLGCCENFLSATPPSAPCLLCHPFEKLAMQLEIKEPPDEGPLPVATPTPTSHLDQMQSDDLQEKMDIEKSTLSQIDTDATLTLPGPSELDLDSIEVVSKRGQSKARGRKRGRPKRSSEVHSQDKIELDGQFEIPVPVDNNEIQTVVDNPPVVVTESPSVTVTSSEPLQVPLVVVQPLSLTSQAVPTSDTVNSISSDSEHPYARLQTPLIIHRNRSPNMYSLGHVPPTSSPALALQQDVTEDRNSSGLHHLLFPNQQQSCNEDVAENSDEILQCTPQNKSVESESNGSVSQNVRRSPRKRTPQLLKTYPVDDVAGSSTYRPPPSVTKKTRKQKLTELSPSQNDDTPTSSSSSQTRRGRRPKSAVSQNVTTLARTDSESVKEKHPMEWGVEEVADFISSIPRCGYTLIFKEHEVDGESLLSLDPEMMVKLMGLKTGPALRIYRKINDLKKQFGAANSSDS